MTSCTELEHSKRAAQEKNDEDDALDTLVIEFPVSADLEKAVDLSIDIGMFLFERLQLPHNVLVRCESIG